MNKQTETIKATPNYSARTFTIRVDYHIDGIKTKYRTLPMSVEEFESSLHHTQNDWKYFLKSDDYYIVK